MFLFSYTIVICLIVIAMSKYTLAFLNIRNVSNFENLVPASLAYTVGNCNGATGLGWAKKCADEDLIPG